MAFSFLSVFTVFGVPFAGVLGGLDLLLRVDFLEPLLLCDDEDEDDEGEGDDERGRFVPFFSSLLLCFAFAGEGEAPFHSLYFLPLVLCASSMSTTSLRILSSISSSTRSMYVISSSCVSYLLGQFLTMLSVLYPCSFHTEIGKYLPFLLEVSVWRCC